MNEGDKSNAHKRYGSKNDQLKTYFNNNTWPYIALAVVYLLSGKRESVRGRGVRKLNAESNKN
jgi:hypothetical protein